jgi:hypothetical protein
VTRRRLVQALPGHQRVGLARIAQERRCSGRSDTGYHRHGLTSRAGPVPSREQTMPGA